MRFVLENILLFLLPTALYCGYRFLRPAMDSKGPAHILNEGPLLGLFIAGALLVAATRIYYATVSPGGLPSMTYTPPRMGKDGTIEPAQIK